MKNRKNKSNSGQPYLPRNVARKLFKTFSGDIWAHRGLLIVSYLAGMVSIGSVILLPWPLKIIIDYVLSDQLFPEPFASLVAGISAEWLIIFLGLSFFVLACIGAFTGAFQKIANAKIRERLVIELRDRMLHHIQTLSLALRPTSRSGELVLTLIYDINQVVRLLTKTLPEIVRHLVSTFLIIGAIFWMEYRLGIAVFLIVVLLVVFVRHYGANLNRASREKRRCEGDVAGLAQEIMRGLPTIQALGHERHTRHRFNDINAESLKAGVNETRIAVALERILQIAKGAAVGLAIGVGALLVFRKVITVGELTVIVAYITQLFKPVEKINQLAATVTRGLVRGEQLFSLLDQLPVVTDSPESRNIERAKGSLEFKDVCFNYSSLGDHPGESDPPVLRNVNLCMKSGQIYVLRGPSGSGKSTLLNLCLRLFDPTSGRMYLDGTPLPQIKLRSLRSQFSVVLQNTHLFAGSIRDVLTTDNDGITDKQLWNALSLVALDEHVRNLPNGLDAILSEDGANFSGGQRTRLSLARAFLLDRPFLILDEPLANVDPTSQNIILQALDRIRPCKTCLIISHQDVVLDRADVVFEIENGSIKEIENEKLQQSRLHSQTPVGRQTLVDPHVG